MKYELYAGNDFKGEGDTMIEAVGKAKIFEIEKISDDKFRIEECRDNYYFAEMTREQLIGLGNELITFAKKGD